MLIKSRRVTPLSDFLPTYPGPAAKESQLALPSDTRYLDDHASVLAKEVISVASVATHVELAAITLWRQHGGMSQQYVLNLLLDAYGLTWEFMELSPEAPEAWQVHEDFNGIWHNLVVLARGERVIASPMLARIDDSASTDYDKWREQGQPIAASWIKKVAQELTWLHTHGLLLNNEAADALPAVVQVAESLAARRWFDGPYALGATLHTQPKALARVFGNEEGEVRAAVALANAISAEAKQYCFASADCNRPAMKNHRDATYMWTSLLKGYLYSAIMNMTPAPEPHFVGTLCRQPREVTTTIVDALRFGTSVLDEEKDRLADQVAFNNETVAIADMPMEHLITLLLRYVESEWQSVRPRRRR